MHSLRTFARVDLDAVRRNFRAIRNAVGAETELLAVVKADAYGHGAMEVAKALTTEGANRFAVASIEEGVELRHAGIAGEITVLGGILPGMEGVAAEQTLTPFIQTTEQLHAWQRQAESQGANLACHLEIDSGMTRTGLSVESARALAELLTHAPKVRIEGIATHLASAENFTDPLAEEQIRSFSSLVCELADLGIRPKFIHHANSSAIAYGRFTGTNLVRPGLALFGYVNPPVGQLIASQLKLEPALEWKARIVTIRDIAAGAVLGYDATYRANRPMRVGVVSVGYGDGLNRRMSNGGIVLAGSSECPIVGLISMDVTLVDLANAPDAKPGDDITLIGKGWDAWQMAKRCGTIPYEILCGISKRVPRLYD